MIKISKDPVLEYCCGAKEAFSNQYCPYFVQKNKYCSLLENGKMDIFFNECRYETLLFDACNIANERVSNHYKELNIDDRCFVDFDAVKSKAQKPKNPKILSVRSYLETVCYRFILDTLTKQGLINRRKKCGSCQHFLDKYCQKQEKKVNKTTKHCKDYQKNKNIYTVDTEVDFEKISYETQVYLFEIISKCLLERVLENSPDSKTHNIVERIKTLVSQEYNYFETLVDICKNLKTTASDLKKQKRFQRQHYVITRLMELILEDHNYFQSSKIICKELGISSKTYKRDLIEVKEYIQNHCLDELAEFF